MPARTRPPISTASQRNSSTRRPGPRMARWQSLLGDTKVAWYISPCWSKRIFAPMWTQVECWAARSIVGLIRKGGAAAVDAERGIEGMAETHSHIGGTLYILRRSETQKPCQGMRATGVSERLGECQAAGRFPPPASPNLSELQVRVPGNARLAQV